MTDLSRLAAYNYPFDEALIAHEPARERDGARLMALKRHTGPAAHHRFTDLPNLLSAGDLLVFNDTRVRKSRLLMHRSTGAAVELLVLEVGGDGLLGGLMRPLGRLKPGECLNLRRAPFSPSPSGAPAMGILTQCQGRARQHPEGANLACDILPNEARFIFEGRQGAHGRGRIMLGTSILSASEVELFLETHGQTPLPPYIQDRGVDPARYQTVYAKEARSAAAPTAGLHFSPGVFEALKSRGILHTSVTLHVGAGTFQAVPVEDLSTHTLHREWCHIPPGASEALHLARTEGRRIIAVGTTSLRVLETRFRETGNFSPGSFHTQLFVRPPDEPKSVQGLVTNFHLPKSTLFMLVCAFAGYEAAHGAYRQAMAERYRFFSFGDAMLII